MRPHFYVLQIDDGPLRGLGCGREEQRRPRDQCAATKPVGRRNLLSFFFALAPAVRQPLFGGANERKKSIKRNTFAGPWPPYYNMEPVALQHLYADGIEARTNKLHQ